MNSRITFRHKSIESQALHFSSGRKNRFDTTIEMDSIHSVRSQRLCSITLASLCFILLIPIGLIFSNAQYSAPLLAPSSSANLIASGYCDSSRLIRCQQDAVRDMQLVGLDAASIQYSISSGPPYSPAVKLREQQQREQQGQAVVTQATCRLVRSNLDCLLNTTPACYNSGLQTAHNSDVILRAKRFLEQSGCNEPDASWQVTFCYRAPEVRACEERYGFTVFSSASSLTVANTSACLAYQAFKYCIESHARLNCKVYEIDMVNEYLIDRAGDLAWRCPHANSSTATNSNLHYGPYGLSNGPSGSPLAPISSYNSLNNYANNRDTYEQRPIPTYVGSGGNANLFGGSVREQSWERFRNPYDDTRFGISRLPGAGSGEVFDRLVAGNAGFDAESSDCPVKAAPYARECEDTLIEQQRVARDSRDGNELQRRICCSLFQYRDCISRVVLDRCADSSPAAVEILMGLRRREMVLTCRGFNRDLCSGALALVSSPMLILAASLVAIFISFKQQQAA